MFNKKLYLALITLLVISTVVYGKKIKKNKRPKDQEELTTIQPNVVAYSTFGFNDVGGHDGFVPTSPDYASFLRSVSQESTTRLYAPAFPSSIDSTGFGGNYGPQTFEAHSFGVNEDNLGRPGALQYTSSSMNFFNNPNFGTTADQNKNSDSEDTNGQNAEDSDAPVYGTKINSRYKYGPGHQSNNNDSSNQNNGYLNLSDDKYSNFHDVDSTHENKPAFSESKVNYQNTNSFVHNYEVQENEEFGKPASSSMHNVLNFPRVVDFTKSNQYYPTELDTSMYLSDTNQPLNTQNSLMNTQLESSFSNNFNYNNNNNPFMDTSLKFGDHYNSKNNEDSSDKFVIKSNSFFDQDMTYNHVNSRHKNNAHSTKSLEQKKKIKHKPWSSGNYSNEFKHWKDSAIKGYGYSTNFSNMNFRYDVSEPKKPFNPDEIVPASSNLVDLTNYQYPESEYSNFKKMPEFSEDDEYSGVSYKDKTKPNDYLNQFKNSFSTVPTTTTSYWGNSFKSTDYSSFRDHPKKPHYSDINSDTVVKIPKRPHKLSYTKPENKPDWPPAHHSRPHKLERPSNDWTKDVFDTRYKSEEDLLGLRTHDTSHPNYLPTYKPSHVYDNDNEFKNLVEKWRQSYLKTKYKDVPVRDYESYGSEVKPTHVPIPKPYPIEVPHPVIVPVPRPFPVRVPVSRPVAVPVLREITVPIEKPVPYPVYKKVPFPVEKLVPVPVEKEVAVPVEKPYPIHIPYVRPVFHHVKPVHEDPENMEEDDYMRRPEPKKPSQYKKRPYGSRNRSRRPSRASYQDRNTRRWPDRRRPSGYNSEQRHHSRPTDFQHSPPYRHRDYEPDEADEEHSDYALYCRRTGNC